MFETGADFEQIFETLAGRIQVLAEVHVIGSHLILDELLVYPESENGRLQVGVGEVLEVLRAIRCLAKADGYDALTVVYHRVGGHRDGRTMSFTRRL